MSSHGIRMSWFCSNLVHFEWSVRCRAPAIFQKDRRKPTRMCASARVHDGWGRPRFFRIRIGFPLSKRHLESVSNPPTRGVSAQCSGPVFFSESLCKRLPIRTLVFGHANKTPSGNWDGDQLEGDAQIVFPDGVVIKGNFSAGERVPPKNQRKMNTVGF